MIKTYDNISSKIVSQYITSGIGGDVIKIALFQNHYFLFEETKYSPLTIKQYETMKDIEGFSEITAIKKIKNAQYYIRGGQKINSLNMVVELYKQNYFKKLDMTVFDQCNSHKEIKNHIYLENISEEQDQITPSEKDPSNLPDLYFADTETYVCEGSHKLQLIGVVSEENDDVLIMDIEDPKYKTREYIGDKPLCGFPKPLIPGEQLVEHFLNVVTKRGDNDAIVWFHNLKYDYNILERYFKGLSSKVTTKGQLYSVVIIHQKRRVELRDSYKLIPEPLSNFSKIMDLDPKYSKSEAVAYNYYTPENHGRRCGVKEYMSFLSRSERAIFMTKIFNKEITTYSVFTKTFDPMEYYKEYLILDCIVLKKGLLKFDKLIQSEITGDIGIRNCLTISGLSNKYMSNSGAYKDIYSIKGNLRKYLGEAVYGGRVCVNHKHIKKVINKRMGDLDGVGLYSSSIVRVCEEIGLPKGKGKRIPDCEITGLSDLSTSQFYKKMTYACLTVRITEVNKPRDMPMIAYKNKDKGSTEYLNSPPPETIVIDNITLEDYIEFHHIKYEVLDGVYWDEGGDGLMGDLIQNLVDTRAKYKKSNPALSNILKLMCNSAYGKTMLKASKTQTLIKSNSRWEKRNNKWIEKQQTSMESFVYNNFSTITSCRRINDSCYEIEKLTSDQSYNMAHIGCMILSMSKRIMNEVFEIANMLGITLYYSDTDSIHVEIEHIESLKKAFFEKYGRTLEGKNLGQFHVDFSLKDAEDEIFGTTSIFLGRKAYLDILESKDKKGITITGYHARLKGITKEGINFEAKKYEESIDSYLKSIEFRTFLKENKSKGIEPTKLDKINFLRNKQKQNGYLELYKFLASGETVLFTLNPFDEDEKKQKVLFQYSNGSVSFRNTFTRQTKF